MSRALTRAGVPCGHEEVFHFGDVGWPDHLQADASWMAACKMDQVGVPVVLLVRHPLAVVRSLVEIGFFAEWDQENPCHEPLRAAFPVVYEWDWMGVQNQALQMWVSLTTVALVRAEMVVRLEGMDAARFGRLVSWAGGNMNLVDDAVAEPPCNRHEESRARTDITYERGWEAHDPTLARTAQALAATLGYQDEGGLSDGLQLR